MRTVRLVDGQPGLTSPLRAMLSAATWSAWPAKPQRNTAEGGLGLPVPPVDQATGGARLRGVPGIDGVHRDPRRLGLVLHEGAKLEEAPAAEQSSLIPGDLPRQAVPEMPSRSSTARARWVATAVATSRFATAWLTSRWNRACLPLPRRAAGLRAERVRLGWRLLAQAVVAPAQPVHVRAGVAVAVASPRPG